MLNLSVPEMAACASQVSQGDGMLVYWEDGALGSVLQALPKHLTTFEGTVVLYGKEGRSLPGLSDLKVPLGTLQTVGSLFIYNMDALTDLTGLQALRDVNSDFLVGGCDGLKSLKGVNGLHSVGKDLVLNSNLALLSVDGLQNLTSVGGQMYLKGNGVLADLSELVSLVSVGSLLLVNNGDTLMALPPGVTVKSSAVPDGSPGGGNFTSSDASSSNLAAGYDGSVLILYGGSRPPNVSLVKATLGDYVPPVAGFDISQESTRFISILSPQLTKLMNLSGHMIIWDDGTLLSIMTPAPEGVTGKSIDDMQPHLPLTSLRSVSGQLVVMGFSPDGPLRILPKNSSVNGSSVIALEGPQFLTSLRGLEALVSVGGLNLVSHPGLLDLTGLSSVSSIKGSLVATHCSNLTSLKGLGSTASQVMFSKAIVQQAAGDVSSLYNKDVSTASEGPGEAESLSSISKSKDDAMTKGTRGLLSSRGMTSVTSMEVHEDMLPPGPKYVLYPPSQKLYTGMPLKKMVGEQPMHVMQQNSKWPELGHPGRTLIDFQDKSTSQALTQIGSSLYLDANPALKDLTGVEFVETVFWDLHISRCPNLTSLEGLASLTKVGGEVALLDNDGLLSTTGMGPLKFVGISVVLMWNVALRDVDALSGLTEINGDLIINGNKALTTLKPLQQVKSVKLDLVISEDDSLQNLTGLDSLQSVGYHLVISDNDSLSSLIGLASLRSIGEDLYLRRNPSLFSLNNTFPKLSNVSGSVYIQDNYQLHGGLGRFAVEMPIRSGGTGA
ncbi:hypothetical protein CEUSTIGMA_g9714.t1 [Chlamydomonas eustigma]|uniref:Receptor L-domain domain-containing protein n=1 Tax=Chlamydomonas eustigma TaxID=1157962 RepID=A0A250XGS6_9CHLO|nr:hypothetical protein CEUSTIGMA_g9714.t1 [Chlamydomonas eustigma]|eukprot:GAX82285.1 hypothetical protein CEUSTIGMA_g9714.t1 [Chlamydomonas eustigma]